MIMSTIEARAPSLRQSERRVAEFVLARPNVAARSSIAAIAQGVGVSEPTVVRFCRSVGCAGFQDLKQKISRDLGRMTAIVDRALPAAEIRATRSGHSIAAGLFGRVHAAFIDLQQALDQDAVEAGADAISNASRIILFGGGSLGFVAADAAHKFERAGVPAIAASDPELQAEMATSATKATVLIALASDEDVAGLAHRLSVARNAGATVIVIAPAASAAMQAAHIRIAVANPDVASIRTPMTSRFLLLFVLDLMLTFAVSDRASAVSVGKAQT